MYDIPEIQDYKQKWLEAERDLAINWVEPPSNLNNCEPIDNEHKDIEPFTEQPTISRKIEDYRPGATRGQVFTALKKVARAPKQPSVRHGKQPVSTSF